LAGRVIIPRRIQHTYFEERTFCRLSDDAASTMWKSLNDALGDILSSSITDDDDEVDDGGDYEKRHDEGGMKNGEGEEFDEEEEEEEEEGGAILNDISSGIEDAAALVKKGGNIIWSGMASAADVIISSVVDDGAALSGDDDEYYHEEDEGRRSTTTTTMGRITSGGDVENDTFEEDDFTGDDFEAEGLEEEEEVLFLDASPSIIGHNCSPPSLPRKHAGFKLESLDVATMRRKLMHAEEQRNMLMQTVESRNDEILKLRVQAIEQSRRQRDFTIRNLKEEVEWWKNLVQICSKLISMTTDDESVDHLKSILDQLRSCDDIVKDSIKVAEERIRELKSRIQAIKNGK
jgi:hypothetical protein